MKWAFVLTLISVALVLQVDGETSAVQANGAAAFAVEPYLLNVAAHEATVAFHLEAPMSATVRVFGPEEIRTFPSREVRRAHFVRILNLAPGQTYTYEVICGEGAVRTNPGDPGFQIRTAVLPGESFTFAVYGDPRPGDTRTHRHYQDVISQIIRNEPSFCLVLGDMVDDGRKSEEWEDFFRIGSQLLRRTAIYPVAGDNDYSLGRGLIGNYFPQLKRGYYHFKWGDVHFFGMDVWDARGQQPRAAIDANSAQVRWLTTQLSRDKVQQARFRVVFLHDPVFISRGRSSRLLREVWGPVFREYGVDIVFASWHMYERSQNDGVTYVVSGGAGADLIWMNKNPAFPSIADARRHHYCRVDVSAGTMTVRAVASDGTVLDSVTLVPRGRNLSTSDGIEHRAQRLRREIIIENGVGTREIPIHLFSYQFNYFRQLVHHSLPRWARENEASVRLLYYDLAIQGAYDLFIAAGEEFGCRGVDIPTLFVGRSALVGEREIESELPGELRLFRENPTLYAKQMIIPFKESHDIRTIKEDKFNSISYAAVTTAGLLDGVSPYSLIAVFVLISYLRAVGGTRRQMLMAGTLFTTAVFLTYLTNGIIPFQLTSWLLDHRFVSVVVSLVLLILVGALAGLSVVDFLRLLTRSSTEFPVQRPTFLKTRIGERSLAFARNRIAVSLAAVGLGIVIAGMKLVYAGQVYLPILTMISAPSHRAAATIYLMLYSTAAVIPLVVLFLLASFSVNSQRITGLIQRHVALTKLGLTIVFITMAVAIVHMMGWMA
ncbi:MAG: metallophosphoesterase [Deltaproteobacteria bacterium]|nr:MAG: metallophosphoesterase [Deltaproteobacteria bacterium]